MKPERIVLLIVVLLISYGTKAKSATTSNTPLNAISVRATLAPSVSVQTAPAPATILVRSNTAVRDLGVGASTILPQAIRLLDDGAVGDYGLLKVSFPADIAEAPLTIITAEGRKLACRATFLAVRDDATGQSLLLGKVTSSIGV